MKGGTQDLLRLWVRRFVYLVVAVVFIVAPVFVFPESIAFKHSAAYVLYGLFIIWTVHVIFVRERERASHGSRWRVYGPAIFAGLFFTLLVSRLYLFGKYGATALGYDTGFYLQYYNLFSVLGTIGDSVLTSHIAYALWFPFDALKIPSWWTINALHVFHQFLTAGAVYFLVRSLPFPKWKSVEVAVIATGLYVLSITQFLAFWWMFYKQSMALPFLLVATGLFLRRSWLAVIVGAFGASIHLQSAVPFVLAAGVFFLYKVFRTLFLKEKMDRQLIYAALGAMALVAIVVALKGPQDLMVYWDYFWRLQGFADRAPTWEVAQAKGLFITLPTYLLNAIFVLPFALSGVYTFWRWFGDSRRERAMGREHWAAFIVALFFSTVVLVSFPFIYQNRSLVLLDLMVIVLAAYPMKRLLSFLHRQRFGDVISVLLVVGMFVFSTRVLINYQPQIFPNEVEELRATALYRDPYDYVMATSSLYTPWVYAMTGFEQTLAPGWLSWDRWTYPMWQEFWTTDDDERRVELLNRYDGKTIYIFVGSYQVIDPTLKTFLETHPTMDRMSPHIWRYRPAGAVSSTAAAVKPL